jgi:hypothetical protein
LTPNPFNLNWNGSPSRLPRAAASPHLNKNTFLFSSRPTTHIQGNKYTYFPPLRSLKKHSNPTPLASRRDIMPVAQYPSTMSSYQRPKYVVYSEHSNPVYCKCLPLVSSLANLCSLISAGSQHEGYRYSMLTSSKRSFYESHPNRGQHSSSSVAYLLPSQPNFQTKGSTVTSSFHFRDPPLRHHHSRSESSYLPSQTYGHRKSRYSAPVPQSSGSNGYDSTQGRGLSRPSSFSQHRYLLPRRSSMHLSRNYSHASRENDPATQESPRVRCTFSRAFPADMVLNSR